MRRPFPPFSWRLVSGCLVPAVAHRRLPARVRQMAVVATRAAVVTSVLVAMDSTVLAAAGVAAWMRVRSASTARCGREHGCRGGCQALWEAASGDWRCSDYDGQFRKLHLDQMSGH